MPPLAIRTNPVAVLAEIDGRHLWGYLFRMPIDQRGAAENGGDVALRALRIQQQQGIISAQPHAIREFFTALWKLQTEEISYNA